MGNFGSNFLRGFQPTFARSFDTSFKYGIDQQEEECKRKEMLKAEQEQQGILSQLIAGQSSQIVPPKMNAQGTGFDVQPQDMSLQEQSGLIGKADNNTLQRYKLIRELNAPKEDEYYAPRYDKDSPTIHRYNITKARDEDTGQPNPNYKPEIDPEFETVQANTVKGYENYPSDYKIKFTKKGDVVTDMTIPFHPTTTSVNINTGDSSEKLDPDYKNILDGYVKEITYLDGLLSHEGDLPGGKFQTYNKLGVKEDKLKREQVEKAVDNKRKELKYTVESNGGEAIVHYNSVKERVIETLKDRRQEEPTIWGNIWDGYRNDKTDKKDAAWLMTQRYDFIADYGYDPIAKFQKGLLKGYK